MENIAITTKRNVTAYNFNDYLSTGIRKSLAKKSNKRRKLNYRIKKIRFEEFINRTNKDFYREKEEGAEGKDDTVYAIVDDNLFEEDSDEDNESLEEESDSKSKRKNQGRLLEKILKKHEKDNKSSLSDKLNLSNLNLSSKDRIKGKANVFYVSPSELPHGVLGLYDPKTHTIYISNELDLTVSPFVYWHEQAHASGIYDEHEADLSAARVTGNYSMIRHNIRRVA